MIKQRALGRGDWYDEYNSAGQRRWVKRVQRRFVRRLSRALERAP